MIIWHSLNIKYNYTKLAFRLIANFKFAMLYVCKTETMCWFRVTKTTANNFSVTNLVVFARRTQPPNQSGPTATSTRTSADPNYRATCSALYANPSALHVGSANSYHNSSHDQRNLMNHSRWWVKHNNKNTNNKFNNNNNNINKNNNIVLSIWVKG